jgi:thiopurine S-methyltransferase
VKQTIDWHQYWTRKTPGFHEARVNRYLERFIAEFHLRPGDRIFVPLCGKAVDLLWLVQQGYDVVGVELSPVAVKAFLDESSLSCSIQQGDRFTIYRASGITLYQGDFMDLQPAMLDGCRLVYDRAAIVAIESFNRAVYCRHLLKLGLSAAPIFMVTLEYDQSLMQGPPFSVPVEEISEHFAASYRVECLLSVEQIDERPRWREMGLQSFREIALRLDPLSPAST